MDFPKLILPRYPKTHEESPESIYWSQFKKYPLFQAYGAVSSCQISHNQKLVAFSHSSRVSVLRTSNNTKKFQISKFRIIKL